jgi:membrane protease YdiL (CAAX protease family)
MNPSSPVSSNSWRRIVAWSAVFGSTVPDIIWQRSGHSRSILVTVIESSAILIVALAALRIPVLRGLTRFLLAIAILNLAWDCICPALTGSAPVRAITDDVSWGARWLVLRAFTLSGAILVSLTLIGSGLTRRDLFLCKGDLAAPAGPIPFLGLRKSIRWTWLGPAIILVFAAALAPYFYLTVHPNFDVSERIIRTLPWSIAVAAVNAASEEFQFRSVLLAHLKGNFAAGEAILLTAVFFGIGHFFGQPSGLLGVLMAGFAGWIWARSMIETRGGLWAFIIHMLQDMVIFTFLVVAAGT